MMAMLPFLDNWKSKISTALQNADAKEKSLKAS